MSPEQIRGEALTPQTDLFAAGTVTLELFTGKKSERNITFYTKGGYKIIEEYTAEDGVVLVKMVKKNPMVIERN